MTATRATKRSRYSVTTQRATHQEQQRPQQEAVEDVELTADSDENSSVDPNDCAQDGQCGEPQTISMAIVMSKMVDTQRKRHTENKQAIFKAYNTASTDLKDSINATFDEHEEQASKAHDAQLQRLQELLVYKAHLEKQLAKTLADLKASYDAHSRDVENVIRYRIKELK